MRTYIIIPILLFFFFSISCSNQEKRITYTEKTMEIDTYLSKTMELHNIPGLALAVIEDNKVIYKNYFGKASLENNSQVDEKTLFRIFSATKLITSTGVFQLIEDGKLNLEDKVSTYLNGVPNQWKDIRIKNLLSHSSGLPDLVRYESTLSDKELLEKLGNDKIEFVTGNQFRYNQTNYWLLAQIIEEVTGTPFDTYVLENQFENATPGVFFSSNSQEAIPNRANRYFYNDKLKEFKKDTNNNGKRGHSGNGLNITLDRFIEWNTRLDNNELLDSKTKSQMWEPFNFTNGKDRFSHGWGSYVINNLDSKGFSGGNLAALRKFTNENITIVLLSNGYEIPAYDIIINDIARMVIPELKEKDLTLEEDVMNDVLNNKFDEAAQSFKKLKKENDTYDFDNLKWNINTIGNSFANNNKPEKARQIYTFNDEANPEWWISTSGIAETYELEKDSVHAIEYYRKSILLNVDNQWNYNELMKKKIEELKNN